MAHPLPDFLDTGLTHARKTWTRSDGIQKFSSTALLFPVQNLSHRHKIPSLSPRQGLQSSLQTATHQELKYHPDLHGKSDWSAVTLVAPPLCFSSSFLWKALRCTAKLLATWWQIGFDFTLLYRNSLVFSNQGHESIAANDVNRPTHGRLKKKKNKEV